MKKTITLIVACGLLLGSCAKSKPADENTAGTVKFTVNAVNVIQPRGDINSTSPDGPIPALAVVDVYAFLKNGDGDYIYNKTIELFDNYSTDTHSASAVLADGTFIAGEYKFLGVGRVDDDGYTLTTPAGANFDDFSASIASAGETNVIFAGSVTQEVLESGASIEIDISRQVAGIFAYFTNVPTEINNTPVAYLRLRVTNANTSVNLTSGEGDAPTANYYYPIDITLTGQDIDDANNVYAGPGDSTGLDILDNSQIASNYALPINGVTMTLELQGANEVALKTWTVRGANGTAIDLAANVLLAIGTKNKAGGTLGADDAEGGDGENADDTPVNLLTDETITVNVLSNWGDVQNLIIEEQ